MSEPFRFPKHPLNDRPNPFLDEQGANPFADETMKEQAEGAVDPTQNNIYAVGAQSGGEPAARSYQHGDFETVLPHRAGLIASLGIIGLVLYILASFLCLRMGPLSLVFLGATVPAWVMGQHDLRAMKVGAMDARGLVMTRVGWICGMIGTAISAAVAAYYIWLFAIAVRNWW